MSASNRASSLAFISPTLARIFIAAVLLTGTTALAEPATAPITEADVVRLARLHNPRAQPLAENVLRQQAIEGGTGLRANPQLAWQRQTQASQEREDSLTVSMPLTRTRQQNVGKTMAGARVHVAESSERIGGANAARLALELFYRCLAQQERIALAESTSERMAEAARVVTRRRDEGQLSGYDAARIELALELARSRVGEAKALYASLQQELALRIGTSPQALALRGSLWPRVTSQVATPPSESPALTALRSAAGVARRAEEPANAVWMPTISATAGLRIITTDQLEYGYVAGLSVNLPIWTGTSALRKQAKAHARLLRSRARAVQTEREIRQAAARATLSGLVAESLRFEAATQKQSEVLNRAATSGYREGQRTLLELIDANNALSAVRTRRLDLQLLARQAQLELRDASGEFE